MNTTGMQLTTILNSYLTKSKLVYNNIDNCFYSVNSLKNLSKNYVTNSQTVQQKVIEFIKQNSVNLNFDLSDNLRQELDNRIKKIDSKTSGILAFFYFLFNPNSKYVLLKNREDLKNLKLSIDEALTEIAIHKKEGTQNETTLDIEDEPVTPATTTSSKQDKHTPILSSHDQPTTMTSALNPTSLQLPQQPQTPGTFIPSTHTPGSTPGMTCMPPPPPPLPLTNGLNPQALLLPGEPARLTFERMNYKKKSAIAITKEINKIGGYIDQLRDFLKPYSEKVNEFQTLRQEAEALDHSYQDTLSALKETKNTINQCKNNIKYLADGLEKNKPVILYYGSDEIPFFPDTAYDFITGESTPQDSSPTQESSTTPVHTSSSPPAIATPPATMLDSFELEVQPKEHISDSAMAEQLKNFQQSLMSNLGIEATSPATGGGLLNVPTPNAPDSPAQEKAKGKASCPAILKISTAINILNEYLDNHKIDYKNKKKELLLLKQQKEEKQKKLKELAETKFLGVYKTSELEKIVETKTQLLKDWENAKKFRENYLLETASPKPPTPEVKNSKNLGEKICETIPEYRIILGLKGHTYGFLKKQTTKCTEDFEDTLWYKLRDQPVDTSAKKSGVK